MLEKKIPSSFSTNKTFTSERTNKNKKNVNLTNFLFILFFKKSLLILYILYQALNQQAKLIPSTVSLLLKPQWNVFFFKKSKRNVKKPTRMSTWSYLHTPNTHHTKTKSQPILHIKDQEHIKDIQKKRARECGDCEEKTHKIGCIVAQCVER